MGKYWPSNLTEFEPTLLEKCVGGWISGQILQLRPFKSYSEGMKEVEGSSKANNDKVIFNFCFKCNILRKEDTSILLVMITYAKPNIKCFGKNISSLITFDENVLSCSVLRC